ncbi:MAG: flagellin [Phycisphaerales bacterium]|nr:flagellin [Phycisphaerales bacterium]
MSRINTNVSSLISQRILNRNNTSLNNSLERLSTGLRINRGADSPAGLIASENLRAEKAGISQAIDNAERATNIIGTAEGGLSEVSNLLVELQTLVSQSANTGGLSSEEVSANQLQVDSILNTINRISQSNSFQGTKLLNGNYDYTTSGVATSAITGLQVNSARIADGSSLSVVVQVVASGQTGTLSYTGGAISGQTVTIEVSGNNGTEQLSFASGTTVSSIATAINGVTTATGVSATISGADLVVNSTGYGAKQFVGLRAITGTFNPSATKDYGLDADVTVNGASAESTGLSVSYRSSNLDVEFDLSKDMNYNSASKTFSVTGGGASFSLGSKVTESEKASIGIQSVSTGSLGNVENKDGTLEYLSSLASGGANALSTGTLSQAQKVVDKAIKQVSSLRGRLGAFQKFTIGSTVNSLGVAFENASAAESAIRDTDFAKETSEMTRAQILSQAASTVLAQANASPQAALMLLR